MHQVLPALPGSRLRSLPSPAAGDFLNDGDEFGFVLLCSAPHPRIQGPASVLSPEPPQGCRVPHWSSARRCAAHLQVLPVTELQVALGLLTPPTGHPVFLLLGFLKQPQDSEHLDFAPIASQDALLLWFAALAFSSRTPLLLCLTLRLDLLQCSQWPRLPSWGSVEQDRHCIQTLPLGSSLFRSCP
ncbi:PREDICTED: uncharacterized protein LOC108538786 [Rhinopithecus bieti]|uniref:uncharacterized protein LOC108538786 n=1 Tax=Rhinopithecus bieti TaxID=61621 RepID=UPI00083C8A27|nr:PREDICTED: uncharacterized protein LOC108538786 [Rhinopithecus bieti]